jgi:uncharacterized RDD family membrane protein YckC
VNACAESLEERAGHDAGHGAGAAAIAAAVHLLLICTVIGIALLPFLAVALLFAAAFGKAAVLAFLGRSLLRAFGLGESAGQAWLTVLIGAVLMAVLYCVPWLGLLIWALTAWIGLGMVVATIMEKRRREKAAAAAAQVARAAAQPVAAAASGSVAPSFVAAAPLPASVPPAPAVAAAVAGPDLMDSATTGTAPAGAAAAPPSAPPLPPPLAASVAPAVAEATLPRAEFGVRLAALLIDLVLVGAVGGVSLAFAILPFPLLFGCYVFAFWLWRGTTIGGIVLNLKVARLDGRPVDAATAAVRTLVAFLSVMPFGWVSSGAYGTTSARPGTTRSPALWWSVYRRRRRWCRALATGLPKCSAVCENGAEGDVWRPYRVRGAALASDPTERNEAYGAGFWRLPLFRSGLVLHSVLSHAACSGAGRAQKH